MSLYRIITERSPDVVFVRKKGHLFFSTLVDVSRQRYGFAIEFRGNVFLRDTQIDRRRAGSCVQNRNRNSFRVIFMRDSIRISQDNELAHRAGLFITLEIAHCYLSRTAFFEKSTKRLLSFAAARNLQIARDR